MFWLAYVWGLFRNHQNRFHRILKKCKCFLKILLFVFCFVSVFCFVFLCFLFANINCLPFVVFLFNFGRHLDTIMSWINPFFCRHFLLIFRAQSIKKKQMSCHINLIQPLAPANTTLLVLSPYIILYMTIHLELSSLAKKGEILGDN